MLTSSNVIGLKLISWQIDAARLFSKLGDNDRLVLISPRQVGKSLLLTQLLLYAALNHAKSTSIAVSPVNRQNVKLFNAIKEMVIKSPLTLACNESKMEISFINGSKIVFISAESGDYARGNTVTKGGILVVDEAAFVKDSFYGIMLPYVNVSRAPIIVSSTPRFKSGIYYQWYSNAITKKSHYYVVNAINYDLSFFRSEETLEDYRNSMSPALFKSEMLGQWLDAEDSVFKNYRECIAEPDNYDVVYCGIDWGTGAGADSTQVICFNDRKQMVRRIEFKSQDPMVQIDSIAEFLNSCPKVKTVLVEKNSIGSIYESALQRALYRREILKTFTTTNNSKKEIIERLVEAFSRKEITILDDSELCWQLDNFVIKELKAGNYTYENSNDNIHDDCVMSLAICVHSFSKRIGQYALL